MPYIDALREDNFLNAPFILDNGALMVQIQDCAELILSVSEDVDILMAARQIQENVNVLEKRHSIQGVRDRCD